MCKWFVNYLGRWLSVGWKRFVVDYFLEEGDVCVFEMIDCINFMLLINIFRIELDDYILELIEIWKSVELWRFFVDFIKRKWKSRVKLKGLGFFVFKLFVYSGCWMEKFGGSSLLLRGVNVLFNMLSYKYIVF